jgi:hypothetical protein
LPEEKATTPRALLGRKLEQSVGRTPELERAAGLQAFAFEPDSGSADLALHQRSALDQPGNAVRCRDNIASRRLRVVR